MQRLSTAFVLAYHGCDRATAEDLLSGMPFALSTNAYDWLGHGAYFWEGDPVRAHEWAKALQATKKINEAAVVGIALDLGLCLDLMTRKSLQVLRTAYDELNLVAAAAKTALPTNDGFFRRQLDCAVVNYLYESMPEPKFQTARGAFMEGGSLFPQSLIQAQAHIQIAVRDLTCIKGVFRVSPGLLS